MKDPNIEEEERERDRGGRGIKEREREEEGQGLCFIALFQNIFRFLSLYFFPLSALSRLKQPMIGR